MPHELPNQFEVHRETNISHGIKKQQIIKPNCPNMSKNHPHLSCPLCCLSRQQYLQGGQALTAAEELERLAE